MSMAAKTGDKKEQEQARLTELNSKIQETVLKSMHISAAQKMLEQHEAQMQMLRQQTLQSNTGCLEVTRDCVEKY